MPRPGPAAPDSTLRIQIASLEAKRGAAVVELIERATKGDVHTRRLALRALGRIGGAQAQATLDAALADPDEKVVTAALSAIGVYAALHEPKDYKPALPAPQSAAAVEALARAGSADAQAQLATCVTDAKLGAACAFALGRHGRRKIEFATSVVDALAQAAASSDPQVRYAATYALSREHQPKEHPGAAQALAARIADEDPEIRATAIAGLAKRKAVAAGRKLIEESLRDVDWRVAVEAARALAGADDAGRELVATSLQRRFGELVKGNATEAHVITEALRVLIGKQVGATGAAAIQGLAVTAKADMTVAPISRGWIECLGYIAAPNAQVVANVQSCALPDHLRLPLLAEVVTKNIGDGAVQRAALRALLGHDDPRVRAAGLAALPSTWAGADTRGRETIVSTITSALASKNSIVAGSAIEAATEVYELPASNAGPALDSAIVKRAETEQDVELAASLIGVITKRKIASGVEACRRAQTGHPVRAKAARDCLAALGEPMTTAEIPAAEPPPGDITEVIGRKVIWHLATTRGAIDIELRPDVAPWAVASIVALTRRNFYDGKELHRVVPNFVAQGGDPTESGWGGPGYTLPAEPSASADGPGFMRGGVGVADAGPDSGGSQWFIMHSRAPHLDGRYTWVGSVVTGQSSADSLLIGDRVDRATVEIK